MSGHRVTPYQVTATRKFVRDPEKKTQPLLLTSLGDDVTVDLLDAVKDNIEYVEPLTSSDGSRTLACMGVEQEGDELALVFGADVSGEREVVHDGSRPERPVVFTKDRIHVTRIYSVCLLWRPADEGPGILLVHSPWGRGGSKGQVLTLIQRAVDSVEGAKAKIHADAMIPAKALDRLVRRASATKVIYRKSTGIRSTFSGRESRAPAEMDLVVKGAASHGFRDQLTTALRAAANRNRFFTIRVRDDRAPSGTRQETFDDVIIDLPTPGGGGTHQYSIARDSVPTMGYDQTSRINSIYYGLPANRPQGWAETLLRDVTPLLQRVLVEVKRDM